MKHTLSRTHVRRRALSRIGLVAALATAGLVGAVTPASASISSPGASSIASTMQATGTDITGATFLTQPSPGTPNGISTAALGDFPTDGSSFAILTNGDVNAADDAPPSTSDNTTTELGGPNYRGNTDYDVSVLKVDFTVPDGMNCMRFDFRFLSDEYPEFLNKTYNDAFIAELDTTDWTTSGSTITAPHNFAFDPAHQPISINAAGNTSMTPGPSDTTYDGATPVLTAAHPASPGSHSLILSIFDQGDDLVDSAVFLDDLVVGHASNVDQQCEMGAAPKTFGLTLTPPTATKAVGTSHTVTATVMDLDPGPVSGGTVLFSVAGVNPKTGSGTTDVSGHATFSYTGANPGNDTITACYDHNTNASCDAGEVFASVAAVWTGVAGSPPPTPAPTTSSPELPATGRPVGPIAVVGLLVMLLGAAAVILARRRRVRTDAP